MKYGSEVLKIIQYGLSHDDTKLRHYAEFLAQKLNEDGDHNSAKRIRTVIDPQYKPIMIYPAEGGK